MLGTSILLRRGMAWFAVNAHCHIAAVVFVSRFSRFLSAKGFGIACSRPCKCLQSSVQRSTGPNAKLHAGSEQSGNIGHHYMVTHIPGFLLLPTSKSILCGGHGRDCARRELEHVQSVRPKVWAAGRGFMIGCCIVDKGRGFSALVCWGGLPF